MLSGVKRCFVFALLCALAVTAAAQTFQVSVSAAKLPAKGFRLMVYDTDSEPRMLKPKGKKGVVFSGTVRGNVSYAELHHPLASRPLPFFIDNGEIAIRFNADTPEASSVTGSRQNSIFRYQLEQCGTTDAECLAQFVAENPTSPVAPYIIERYILPQSDYETTLQLYEALQGDARRAYHYRRLGQRLEAQAALAVGAKLPSMTAVMTDGKTVHFDSLWNEKDYNILLVGSSYCSPCKRMLSTMAQAFPELTVASIDVDSLAGGWDAPLMQQLDIDHIPYLLVIGPDRSIVARDARVWELKRIIEK